MAVGVLNYHSIRHGPPRAAPMIEAAWWPRDRGAVCLNYLQSKIYSEDVSVLCRLCEEESETFDHLLNECPCFQQARFDILHNQPIINTTKWDSADIIKFSHIPAIDVALTFE